MNEGFARKDCDRMNGVDASNRRMLKISNFRNIGGEQEADDTWTQYLVLNRSIKPGEMGGLVILIGSNNCGKSNVLGALNSTVSGIKKEDVCYLNFPEPVPIVEMIAGSSLFSNNVVVESEESDAQPLSVKILDIMLETESCNLYRRMFMQGMTVKAYHRYLDDAFRNGGSPKLYEEIKQVLERKLMAECEPLLSLRKQIEACRSFSELFSGNIVNNPNQYSHTVSEKVSGASKPNVIVHDFEEPYRTMDLECKIGQLSQFFIKLFEKIGVNPESLKSMTKSPQIRLFETDLNRKLKKISDNFNGLFLKQEKQYEFTVSVIKQEITLEINSIHSTTGIKSPCPLDSQSLGFRWLFDFYFKVLMNNNLRNGDIILLDEFGDHLNYSSVKDVANELRRVAHENGLTFVIATQNPMLIDTAHLDEVRLLMPTQGGYVRIYNDFEDFTDGPDPIRQILSSMTISRNYLRKETRKTIFTSEASTYFCLSAFSHMRSILKGDLDENEDLDFLPLNGIGAKKGDSADIIRTLHKNEVNPILLTEDGGLADCLKSAADDYGDVALIYFDDVFHCSSIKEAFSAKDFEHYFPRGFCFDDLAIFSQNIERTYDDLDEETKENFNTILLKILSRDFGFSDELSCLKRFKNCAGALRNKLDDSKKRQDFRMDFENLLIKYFHQ